MREPAVKNLDVDQAIRVLVWASFCVPTGRGKSLLRYQPWLERLLSPSPFWVEPCNQTRQSIACTHSQKKGVVVR